MKSLWLVIALMAGFIVNFPVTANDDFNSGMNYAKGQKGKDLDTFKSFKPADNLPDYSSSPDATKYYGGVQSSGTDLTSPGSNTLNNTEWGKAVTDSISKQPKDMVTADSPFLDNGRNAENNAETVFDPKLCESKEFEKSVFTNYVCDRDLQVQQYCTRTATITGDWTTDWENKYYEISPAYSRNGKQIVFSFTMPASGVIQSANLKVDSSQYLMKSQVNFMNTTFFINQNEDTPLNAAGMNITKDQIISGTSCSGSGKCTGSVDDILYQAFLSGKAKLTLKNDATGRNKKVESESGVV